MTAEEERDQAQTATNKAAEHLDAARLAYYRRTSVGPLDDLYELKVQLGLANAAAQLAQAHAALALVGTFRELSFILESRS
jgi:hypothetical protein